MRRTKMVRSKCPECGVPFTRRPFGIRYCIHCVREWAFAAWGVAVWMFLAGVLLMLAAVWER